MPEKIDIYSEVSLPIIPLRGLVAFPAIQLNIEIARPISLKAFTAAATMHDAKVLLVAQKDASIEDPKAQDLYKIGVLAEIKHVVKTPHGNLSVVFEGVNRAKIRSIEETSGFMKASAIVKEERQVHRISPAIQDLEEAVKKFTDEFNGLHPNMNEDIHNSIIAITDPGYLADFIASTLLVDPSDKQNVLEITTPTTRLERLFEHLQTTHYLLQCEHDIQAQVRDRIDKNQKDYFLREQIKAISQSSATMMTMR